MMGWTNGRGRIFIDMKCGDVIEYSGDMYTDIRYEYMDIDIDGDVIDMKRYG
jgi:hypothetical protein